VRWRPAFAAALGLALVTSPASAADRDPDPWFATDKALHFGLAAGIAGGSYAAAASLLDARGHALLVAGGVTLAAGAAKEALDLAGLGNPSWRDFAWDCAGTLVGLAVGWSIDLMVRGIGDRHRAFGAPRAGSPLVLVF
jgi:putative lipoprotein